MNWNAVTDWIVLNIPFIIVIIILIGFCVRGWKEGFVSELFSFISAILASVAIFLLAYAVRNVFDNKRITLVVAIVLLILLGIFHRMINLLFESLRLVAKIPGINIINRLAGILMAVLETLVIVWAVYCVIIMVDTGAFGDWIYRCTKNNGILTAIYKYNYLYKFAASLSDKIRAIDIWTKLGM